MLIGPAVTIRKILALSLPPVSISQRIRTSILIVGTIAIGLALAWLPLNRAILLVGGSILLVLILLKPILSLYLLIPVIPFSSLLAVTIGEFKAGLMESVLAISIAAWLLKSLANQNSPGFSTKLRGGPLWWLFLLFLGGVSLSWLNTLSIGDSLVETVKWVEMFILYLFIVNMLPARQIKWIVLILLLTGMGQAILGLYQFIFKVGPPGFELFDGRFLRAYGSFAQPNPYGGYLGLLLPLALSVTIWNVGQIPGAIAPRSSSTIETNFRSFSRLGPVIFKYLYLLLRFILISLPLGLLIAALFASQSRGAWVGFAMASVVTLIVPSKKVAIILASLILVGASVGLIGSLDLTLAHTGTRSIGNSYAAITGRFADVVAIFSVTNVATTPVTDANFAAIERLAHWQAAREMWRDNPWLGVGFGNYAAIYPAYAVGRWLDPLGHAHNYLLNIGAETGLVGISVYLIFWIFAFRLLWMAIRHSEGFHKAVAAGGLGIIVHLHVHNLVDNLYVQGMYLHIAIILGVVSVIYRQSKASQIPRQMRK